VPLVNPDFNSTSPDSAALAHGLPTGWKSYYRVAEFSATTATEASGNRYLEITGRGIVNYGKNASTGHTVAVNGIKLYYETYGSGEPLLLLHGNGQSIGDFAPRFLPWPVTTRLLPWTPAPRANRPPTARS
jgi:hypothetical protein